jgi:hypothetical protein
MKPRWFLLFVDMRRIFFVRFGMVLAESDDRLERINENDRNTKGVQKNPQEF